MLATQPSVKLSLWHLVLGMNALNNVVQKLSTSHGA